MRAQQLASGFSASFQLYVQKNELLIRSSSGFAMCESFGKPGSLSDPHRSRAEKPGAGKDFHIPAQQTEPQGEGEGWWGSTSPMIRNPQQVKPGCHLIRMKRCSG